ncbi:hypothetical protein Tco_1136159 [Tanacetum coccineum]
MTTSTILATRSKRSCSSTWYNLFYNIAQGAPSTSASIINIKYCIIHSRQQGICRRTNHRRHRPITHDVLHPSFNPVPKEPGSAQSSSGNVNSAKPNQVTQPPDHLKRWTKDHPQLVNKYQSLTPKNCQDGRDRRTAGISHARKKFTNLID